MSGGSSGGQSYVTVTLAPDPGLKLIFHSFRGSEELGRPFDFDLDLVSATGKVDLIALLGSSATIKVTHGSDSRYFNGIVAAAAYGGLIGGAHHYRLELRPWIWLLSRTQNCCIFQKKSVWDIITTTFRNAGFSSFSDKRQNSAGSQVLEYCVQYNETSFDFVTRLMEVYGLYYYFTHEDGQHTLVMADDPGSHTALGAAIDYAFDMTEVRQVKDQVWEWTSDLRLQPGAATYRDYNFTTPSADLTAKSIQAGGHTHGSLEVYEYPGPYGTAADGQKLSDVRMQHLAGRRQVLRGSSNARGLYTGCKFTLSGFPEAAQNREYLLIAASYALDAAEGVSSDAGDMADTFRIALTAIPGTVPFRLDNVTRWPVMRGPQTAKVVGESGEEITTDQYGRIKVQFPWDRVGTNDENSSCWIRVAQIWAGTSWGGIWIPRIGQEVVVDFLDGHPDRPIITGAVYNASTTVPYALPDNKTRSTIKTRSSMSSSGFNELRFEDKAGSEEVFFQAQKDYNKVVLNTETQKITQDSTITVDKGNRAITLNSGDQSLTVSKGKRSVTVSQGDNAVTVSQGNDSLTISQGNYTINVTAGSTTLKSGQDITIQSGSSITLKVALSTVVIDSSGVTIKGPKISIKANAEMEADGGGMMTLKAGAIAIN